MKKEKNWKVGDIHHWEGYRNSDTGEIDGGYLYIVKSIGNNGMKTLVGKSVRGVKNRWEAIKKYQYSRI